MKASRTFARKAQIVYREEADGAFLLDPDSGLLKYMNRTAREIYRMLDGPKDLDLIVACLRTLYPGTDAADLRRDAEGFLNDLARQALIAADSGCSHAS